MKKKAVMIKHFYSADGALHVNEEVIVEVEKNLFLDKLIISS